ncbi:RICIN domain-containing protein [Streptomyces sp. NPDC053755]|uniref:RICIN domain-containing protein n=1 Tax=Streptomyces sp. NPDC053755 TaxID=3155815 RepID=UPI0034423B4C
MSVLKRAAGIGASVAVLALLPGTSTASAATTADPVNTFQNQETGRCIDHTNEGGLRAFPCNNTNAQKWYVKSWGDGTRRFQNVLTGKCIDDSNVGFRVLDCNDGVFQSWFVKRWNDGTLELKNQGTNRCMDDTVAGGFRTWDCNASPAQSWF